MAKLLRFKDLINEGVICSRKTIDRMERRGEFPRRVPIGTYSIGWAQDEVRAQVQKWKDARSKEIGVLGSYNIKKRGGRPPRFPRVNDRANCQDS